MTAGACPSFAPQGEFLRRLLAAVDCHAQSLGQGGYQALAAPGSSVSLALTGLLTIVVALFGYRMLFGETPTARDGVMTLVKIGIVLALATSWPAFRPLVYDVALRGPAELAAGIGRPAGLPGAEGGLAVRLQGLDHRLAELQLLGTGKPPNAEEIVGPTQALTPAQQQQEMARLQDLQHRPRWDPALDRKMLAQARTLYLAGAIGAYASVRLVAGLLLALAPLFALFLLFRGTRGLFEGWVRGLAGAALGATATSVLLGVQLALMEPWLASVLAARRAMIATPTVPVELLVLTLVFALVLLAALVATAWVARGFRIPDGWRAAPVRWADRLRGDAPAMLAPAAAGAPGTRIEERSRAFAIADAVAATQRRELYAAPVPPARLVPGAAPVANDGGAPLPAAVAPGAGHRRRTRGRHSAGAARRDLRT